jgi:universal stress protein E
MRPIRRILVAIKDLSASEPPVVAKAAQIARACGAHIELFHAIKASDYGDSAGADKSAPRDLHKRLRGQYMQRLVRIAARLRLHKIKVSTAAECDYPAGRAIVRRACLIDADLIVAGRHDPNASCGFFPRLTDWELLRQSPVPVLLVKRSCLYRHPNVLAAVDPELVHAKPAELDDEILGFATALARTLRGNLHAIHAYAPMVVGSAATSVSDNIAVGLEEIAAAEARIGFESLLATSDIPANRRHLIGASPAEAISATARRTRADIVVMGTLSRSGVKGLFIGNTAERLMKQIPCDVLILQPARFASRARSALRRIRTTAGRDVPDTASIE